MAALLLLPLAAAGAQPAGLSLATIFTDHAVLQRAPEAAAIYGVVRGEPHATGVNVTVSSSAGSYSVAATHLDRVSSSYVRWKAALRPTAAGTGSHSITATCEGCSAASSASIHDVGGPAPRRPTLASRARAPLPSWRPAGLPPPRPWP